MQSLSLYDHPSLYDRLMPPGPCEPFYASLFPAGASVLELGCGTGRLSVPLALAGFNVTGLDGSPAMLSAAARKAARAGASVEWVEDDMTTFDLGRRYDLVLVPCNSLAHLTSAAALAACLASIRRHLAPEGVLAFDVVAPDPKLLRRVPTERRRRTPPGSALRLRELASYSDATRVRRLQWRIIDSDGSERCVELRLRQFFPDELSDLLEACGLQLAERYGDFDRARFTGRSRLQVCLATHLA